MANIVELDKVKKRYGNVFVLDNISVTLEAGKIYGLLGMNGAGKTTLMRVITGLTSDYTGTLRIHGTVKLSDGRRQLGCTIENPVLFENLTAFENLKMYHSIFRGEENQLKDLLVAVGLENGNKPVRKFSLGMKQKLALAVALLGEPAFVILDEPTNGLDPITVKDLRKLIAKMNRDRGVTFLISSHDVNELIKTADVFLIMQEGKIKYEVSKHAVVKATEKIHADMEEYIIGLMEEK